MATIFTQRYRPLTTVETSDGEGYSSRFVRDAARNMNVLKAYVTRPFVLPNQAWPNGRTTVAGNTAEQYFCKWGPAPFPRPYEALRFRVNGYIHAGAGTVQLRLHALRSLYGGGYFWTAPSYDRVGYVTIAGGSTVTYPGTIDNFTPTPIGDEPLVYLVAFFRPSNISSAATIYTIAAWPTELS